MNTCDQTTLDFIQTRSRRTDGDTSRVAAKHAASCKADQERAAITMAVLCPAQGLHGLTARECAIVTGIEYIEVQRRISECGLIKSELRRGGCAVWLHPSSPAAYERRIAGKASD